VEFDSDSLNPHFSYEENGVTHRVWMLDAVTAYNQERAAERLGCAARYCGPGRKTFHLAGLGHGSSDDAARSTLRAVPPATTWCWKATGISGASRPRPAG